METDELIRNLSAATQPVAPRAAQSRIAVGMGAGIVLSLAGLALWLGFRPDLGQALATYPFWMKAFYTLSVSVLATASAAHLSRPEVRLDARHIWLAAPVIVLASLAVLELLQTPIANWLSLWLGHSARQCPFRILALAIPVYAGLVWSFQHFAPARPSLAGGAAGAAAGGVAATIYALHCPEVSAIFVFTWYSLGILAAAFAGAAAGRYLLRW